jgi:hypothetical protein
VQWIHSDLWDDENGIHTKWNPFPAETSIITRRYPTYEQKMHSYEES